MMNLQFRIWDRDRKQLSMVQSLHWNFERQQLMATTVFSNIPIQISENDLMVFSGQQDEVGQPIFVNDIVEVTYSPEIFDPEITKRGVVIYNDGFYIQTRQQDLLSLDVFDNIAKLGDIYRNSELLLPPKPTYGDKLRGMQNEEIVNFLFKSCAGLGEKHKTAEGFLKFLNSEVIKEDL